MHRQFKEHCRVELSAHTDPKHPPAVVGCVGDEEQRKEADEEAKPEAISLAEALRVGDDCARSWRVEERERTRKGSRQEWEPGSAKLARREDGEKAE